MARAGRRPGTSTSSAEILEAARVLFAERGFRATTVRAVAAAAGVNPALVHHHFGSKDGLFVAAMDLPVNPADLIVDAVSSGPRDELGERLARVFVRLWSDPVTGPRVLATLRTVTATEEGAGMVRTFAEGFMLERVSAALGIPPLRVAGAMTQLIGLALGTVVLRIGPLAEASEDELVELIAPSVQRYLDG